MEFFFKWEHQLQMGDFLLPCLITGGFIIHAQRCALTRLQDIPARLHAEMGGDGGWWGLIMPGYALNSSKFNVWSLMSSLFKQEIAIGPLGENPVRNGGVRSHDWRFGAYWYSRRLRWVSPQSTVLEFGRLGNPHQYLITSIDVGFFYAGKIMQLNGGVSHCFLMWVWIHTY